MILHFSHIGLTEGRTFMLKSLAVWGWLGAGPQLVMILDVALEAGAAAATASKGRSSTGKRCGRIAGC
jgi:hypothetical protein